MSINLSVVKNLENNRVLIQEQSGRKNPPRLYVAQQDKADEFINQRKLVDKNNKIQKIGTYVMSAVIGLLVGGVVKFGSFGKLVSGLVTGAVALFSGLGIDKKMDKSFQNNTMKNFNIEEVTGQKPEDIK